jgi:hypothetical protein
LVGFGGGEADRRQSLSERRPACKILSQRSRETRHERLTCKAAGNAKAAANASHALTLAATFLGKSL